MSDIQIHIKAAVSVLIAVFCLTVFSINCALKSSAGVPGPVSMAGFEDAGELDSLEVHYIDVGQGDAALILCGGHAMLIDAGGNDRGTAVQLYLKKQGVRKLDYVIGTHLDSDHIGGLDVVLTKFDCDTVIMPEHEKNTASYRDVLSAMAYRNYKNTLPVAGAVYPLGDAEFTIISPVQEYENANNNSVGLILRHGGNKFLFTGDVESDAEEHILANGLDISCDVYQVGHHGSNSSSSEAFMDAADPAYAVISCGEGNPYGHPRAETLNRFRERGIKVFRTDEQGTIVAESDGNDILWNCSPSDTWKAGEPVRNEKETAGQISSREDEGETISDVTYILNTSSKKFHFPDCDSVPRKNRRETNRSREEIIAEGYVPCKRCNP